jgi:SAM-dependent methyltransferase
MIADSLSSLDVRAEASVPSGLPWRLCPRFPLFYHFHYVFFKLLLDPVYRAALIELNSKPLPLLDIGCGPGLLACYLRACGFSQAIHGIDYDAQKIDVARRVMNATDSSFEVIDVRERLPDHSGHVTILDILQFFTPCEQTALLEAAAARVARGGKLIIRSCLREEGWRFRLSQAGDIFARMTFWLPRTVFYPSRETVLRPLETAGLRGRIRRLSGPLPFNNFLLVFERP